MAVTPSRAVSWTSLSRREREIAGKFAEGLTYQQIGERLFIAPATVRAHLAAIYRKLDVHNKAALVRLVLAQEPGLEGATPDARPEMAARRPLSWIPLAALGLFAAVFLYGIWQLWPAEPAAGKPALAVLPFDNLDGDAASGRLADGLTEDIITDLARFRDLDVIARNSAAVYRGKPVDLRRVGRDLDVRYVIEGSLRRQDGRVRITAQLLDALTGAHVWAERWDRPADDLFAVQGEIAEKVAATLGGWGLLTTVGQQAAQRRPPGDLSAYETYLLGAEAKHRFTLKDSIAAVRLLDEAVAKDPMLSRAWSALAWAYSINNSFGGDLDPDGSRRLSAARRAVELDPMDADAHAALGATLGTEGDFPTAEAEFDRALELNSSNAHALFMYAAWASTFGKPVRGLEAADRAVRLDPSYPVWANSNLMYAYFMGGRYAAVAPVFERTPQDSLTEVDFVYRAASYAMLGQAAAARAAVADALQFEPGLSIEGIAAQSWWSEAERMRLIDTMRAAGFPACATSEGAKAIEPAKRLSECAATVASG